MLNGLPEIWRLIFLKSRSKFFYLRGGFNYNKLPLFDKVVMTLLKWKLKTKKKEELTPDDIGMLEAYDKPVDFTRKSNIEEIVAYVNSCH